MDYYYNNQVYKNNQKILQYWSVLMESEAWNTLIGFKIRETNYI